MSVLEKFKEHFSPGFYTRIDSKHPLDIYIGMDEKCNYALEFRGKFKPHSIKSSTAINIQQYQKNDFSGIIFSLKDHEMLGNFCVFCEDVINSTSSTSDEKLGYKLVINRFYLWKKMFQNQKHIMNEFQIMGLIGELLFLKNYMFPKYGCTQSLQAWSGQDLTHKDFSLDTIWYEVKTINIGKASVKISSLEQLQSVNVGELVVYQLERMSEAYNGININQLASDILKTIDSNENKDLFINKLIENGFSFESIYYEYNYDVYEMERFLVNETFPKLTSADVNEAIIKVQYELLLSQIKEYKIN